MTETKLSVPDMSCAHCEAAVEGSLNALSGIESSNADFARPASSKSATTKIG